MVLFIPTLFLVNVCLRSGSIYMRLLISPNQRVFLHTGAAGFIKTSTRAIACGWPPETTGVCIALFSSIRFKECARQILSPKIISFYWCSKCTHGGVSWAKWKLSCRQAQGFLLSGERFPLCENFTVSFLWESLCLDAKKVAQSRSSRSHFIWQRLLV